MPIAMAAAADMFPLARRGLVLGIIGGAAEAGGVLGPLYGAGLSMAWSWRLIFLVNIPLCLHPHAGLLAAAAAGSRTRRISDAESGRRAGGRRRRRAQALVASEAGWTTWARRSWPLSLAGVTIGLGTGTQMVNTGTGDAAQSGSPVRWPWLRGRGAGLHGLHPLRAARRAAAHPARPLPQAALRRRQHRPLPGGRGAHHRDGGDPALRQHPFRPDRDRERAPAHPPDADDPGGRRGRRLAGRLHRLPGHGHPRLPGRLRRLPPGQPLAARSGEPRA